MRPKRDKSITHHANQDMEVPTDEEPERRHLANPRPTDLPARNLRNERGLQQKANTKSPLKGHGVVTTDIAGVNFEETSSSALHRRRPLSGAKRQEKPSSTAEQGLGRRQHENDQTTAPPSGQQDPDHDADGSYVDEAREDDAESASDEDARREAKERTKQRREALDGIEQAATLFERQEAWIEMIIAGRALRSKQNSTHSESESGKRAMLQVRQIRSLFTTSHADGHTPIDMKTMRQRYNKHCRLYHTQLDAFQPDSANTSHGRDEQSRDLHQHLIPALLEACKAALQTLFQGTQPAWAEFDLLAELLLTTARSVKKAQDWSPRPTTMDGGILGDMRNKVGKNIKNILNLFTNEAKALRAQIDEEALLKKLGKLQEENQARFWQDIKDRRARILRRARVNVRQPLADITTQVIDIDDLNLSGTQQSTRTVQNSAVQQIRVWSDYETHALLIGLKQYAGLDALRKIHDARYKELDSISIEDMRQRLLVLQDSLQGDAGATEDPFLRHVVSFPN